MRRIIEQLSRQRHCPKVASAAVVSNGVPGHGCCGAMSITTKVSISSDSRKLSSPTAQLTSSNPSSASSPSPKSSSLSTNPASSTLSHNINPNGTTNGSSLFTGSPQALTQHQPARFVMTQQRQSALSSKINVEDMFELTYKQILDELVEPSHIKLSPLLGDVKKWLAESLDHNLKNGKRFRAKSLVIALEHLIPGPDEETVRLACLLGWGVELLQAYFLIVDDIMDHSITRRGQLCWYRKENVGMIAINDAIMINNSIYAMLNKHFSSHPNYVQIVDLFNEITRFTAFGQCLDVLSNPMPSDPLAKSTSDSHTESPADLKTFSDERQATIVQYKTSYYTFCLPVRLAMYLANIHEPEVHRQAESILLRIGHMFQVQDDYLDCYGDPTVTGKIGTDIEDGKCGWLAVRALEKSNAAQRAVMDQYYGLSDPESVGRIKELYRQLGLREHFELWEKNQYDEICGQIEKIDEPATGLSKKIFHQVLDMIYRRKK